MVSIFDRIHYLQSEYLATAFRILLLTKLTLLAGFQLLHAVYIVEAQLENLVKRRCNFSIVFFDGTVAVS